MKLHLCSFADSRLQESSNRLLRQATDFGCFNSIKFFDESLLDISFRKEFSEKLKPNVRGFGYWVWKPQVILQTFAEIEKDSILLYLDVGCHLNLGGKQRFQEYIDQLQSSNNFIMATELGASNSEKQWTKGDLLDYFSVRDNANISGSSQIAATFSFLKKNADSIDFVQSWLSTFRHDFTLVDDTPSTSPNEPEFIEHRHDQSVFSVLSKLAGLEKISVNETYPSSNAQAETADGWATLKDYPIHTRRDKKFVKQPWGEKIVSRLERYGLLSNTWTRR
ncbi:MAG: hypothetical protein LAT78_09015 [Roseinatronobacter sp.]|nr:hypothetical protein [Roseinatronobacter sp.]